ncbi:Uncharacterised protein [Acinetobacter baumannii]|nr:Uncharacterised protein [Acinetobacter baumannii]
MSDGIDFSRRDFLFSLVILRTEWDFIYPY